MIEFTLDTNCVIDIDEGRPDAIFIKKLADAHLRTEAHVFVVAMMASEKQKSGGYLRSFTEFSDRLRTLGLSHLKLCLPLCYLGISFLGCCVLAGPDLSALERKIHDILFPDIEFDYQEFCEVQNLDSRAAINDQAHKWRNAKCDVQAIWSHIHNKIGVFVTSDKNFLGANRQSLLDLGAGQILNPRDAAGLLP